MIEVKLYEIGFRFGCVACGGLIEKFEIHGAFDPTPDSGGYRLSLCGDCMVSNDLPARLRREAETVRENAAREAAWIESLANETWNIPTLAEIAQAWGRSPAWNAEAALMAGN